MKFELTVLQASVASCERKKVRLAETILKAIANEVESKI